MLLRLPKASSTYDATLDLTLSNNIFLPEGLLLVIANLIDEEIFLKFFFIPDRVILLKGLLTALADLLLFVLVTILKVSAVTTP